MKDIDTETRNNTVADDVTAGEDMAVERGVKLTRPIERGGEKITYVEITGAIEQAGSLRGLSLSDVLNLKADIRCRSDNQALCVHIAREVVQVCP